MGEKMRHLMMTDMQFRMEKAEELQKRCLQEVKIDYLICLCILRGDSDLQWSLGVKAKWLRNKLLILRKTKFVQERR